MIKHLLSCIALISFLPLAAQDNQTELGFGLGGFNYTGDLTRSYKVAFTRPGATGFYKYNISNAVNFRAAVTAGFIYGSDSRTDDPFSDARGQSFRVFAFEATTGFEYNFIDFKGNNPLIYGTPYLYAGFGIAGFSGQQNKTASYSPIQPVLPLAFGFKYTLTPNWYLGIEFGARFTFFDYLDEVSYGDPRYKNYQYGNWYDNDMYYFTSITATYSFYKIPCPRNPYK